MTSAWVWVLFSPSELSVWTLVGKGTRHWILQIKSSFLTPSRVVYELFFLLTNVQVSIGLVTRRFLLSSCQADDKAQDSQHQPDTPQIYSIATCQLIFHHHSLADPSHEPS
ncbi:hypothetical protein B0I73DRAFT_166406 [Yarrowia lipolytica]|nr:hypothetical protein B0I73DRAFT_166406 [Yarrowia lipolytica]